MSFKKLQWLFPIAVTLHNGEEAIWMPGWALRHAGRLPMHPPGALLVRVMLIALVIAAFAVTYLSEREGPRSVWAYLLFGGIVAMLVNVFVPHVPATLSFRSYTPGVVTAVLANLPVMSYLALRAVRERWVSGGRAAAFGVGVPVGLGGAIFLLMVFGHR
jgi:hypothetical protein